MPSQNVPKGVDVSALDPDQRTSALERHLPRARLSSLTLIALWVLRIYVLLAIPLVVYVFARTLRG